MFGIALFGFVLLLIDDWQCKSTFKVFFRQSFTTTFSSNFLPPKLLLYGISVFKEAMGHYIIAMNDWEFYKTL